MSKVLIQNYLNDLARLKQVGGTHRESVVSEAFKDLLKGYARSHELVFIPQYQFKSTANDLRTVDGALLHALRMPFGYWEAKDEKDDLDAEIAFKFKRGYPKDNIIFEDSTQAVLIQNGNEVIRCKVDDVESLQKLLKLFFAYERTEIVEFRKAVKQFTTDLPEVLKALREMIDAAHANNEAFRKAAHEFLAHAQKTINPGLVFDDVREILIQHILTDEIFDEVFPGQPFHKENNVAQELHKLEDTFFTGNTKFQTLKSLEVYYRAIRAAAARIDKHPEKQAFLKTIYENFYKVYNPKAADRLGVVYTPNEIVRFMIESADWLCEHHFKRNLIDRDVEILDPAVGTGTFITELIEHFRGQPAKLKHKYLEELHANEIGILPYYVANLNIEATYAAIMNEYLEFPGLCLVDTLDNVAGLGQRTGAQIADLFSMGDENVARIKRQNKRKISVIIGNPPYNANQANENDNNKNREYAEIDRRIKDTYIKASTAQKTKLYDMYARFFRWASDRLHDDGVVAFISNRSYIETRSFDGFRKCIQDEFDFAYVIDLGGDIRTLSGKDGIFLNEEHTIFGVAAAVGVAMCFLVKRRSKTKAPCKLFYIHPCDIRAKRDEKFAFLQKNPIGTIDFEHLTPDARNNWINITRNDFDTLMPIATKAVKQTKKASQAKAIFKMFSLGVSTNRDEWLYGLNEATLSEKAKMLLSTVDSHKQRSENFANSIKWSETLKRRANSGHHEQYDALRIVRAAYRPFFAPLLYQSEMLIDRPGLAAKFFPPGEMNAAICFSDAGSRADYVVLAINGIADLHFGASIDAYQQVPLSYFDEGGNRADNITDWALKQFKDHYRTSNSTPPQPSPSPAAKGKVQKPRTIDKQAIFHYVYAVLHDPVYRETYAQNLKREFPRIPLYPDFWRWAAWGEALMALHIGYESIALWPLTRTDIVDEKARAAGQSPKPSLKADKQAGRIVLDSETTLFGIPPEAWDYKLGNRCALEWILDQYKEKKPKDPTIRAKFDTYRFADYKDKVIDLLLRVTRVSVETQAIVHAMRAEKR